MAKNGLLIVVSGPSGVGKGTVLKEFMNDPDLKLSYSVSMTPRPMREGEQEGVNYYYVTRQEFEKTIEEGGLLEWTEFVGNYYGTPRAYVEQKINEGKNVILEIEIQGARNIRKLYPESVLVFITPPTADELERRLKGRGTETEEKIAARLSRAFEESEGIDEYDFIVVNDDLDKCVKDVLDTINTAKRQPFRNENFIDGLIKGLEKYHR